jgi:hypothetical protein
MLIIELTKFYFIILVGEGGVFHIHIFVRMSEISLKRRYIPTIYHHIFYIFFFAKSMSQHKRFLSKRTRLLFRPFSSSTSKRYVHAPYSKHFVSRSLIGYATLT